MKDAETNRLMGSLWIDPRQPVLFTNGKSCYAVNWAMVIAKHVMCERHPADDLSRRICRMHAGAQVRNFASRRNP